MPGGAAPRSARPRSRTTPRPPRAASHWTSPAAAAHAWSAVVPPTRRSISRERIEAEAHRTLSWEVHMNMLAKWATGRNVHLLLVIFLLFNFVAIPGFYPKFATLDTLPSYTPEEAYQHLESYGSQGRQQYLLVELTLDVIYPLATALFFSLLIIYSFRRGFPDHPWTRWLALIPLAELAVDYLENACVVAILLG